ncbi:MAG: hypothetical protein MK081_15580 [Flavobacteriales bacterium]|nr:hypothetical protein [Flavobacteriales bacterium]
MCPQTVGVAHLVLDQAANNNIINGNFINTDTDGNPMTSNDGTAFAGVFIGVGCSDNQIGGTLAGEGNTISGVGLHGLVLLSTAGNGNSFRGNTIFGNGGLGIDRGFDWWPNENDAGDADAGPNDGINHPVIEQVAESGDDYIISILVDAAPSTTYVVDLYANAECDDSEYGEGRYYITSIEMTTDGSGQASVDYTHTPEAEHAVFSALMTNVATNSSSEFGPCVAPVSPEPNIVWSPTAISKTIIAGNSDSEQLFIENTGVVPLTYEVSTDQDWIIPTETSGTLNPGESSAQYITFDAANLPGDEIHGGNIYITSNDPDTPEVEIPVLVEVNYTGMFEVSEEVVFLSIATGQQTTYGLTITNNGTENVTWSGSTDVTANWLTQVLPSGGTLDADGGSTELDVHINTNGVSAGNYVGVVIFNSNASLNPTLVVEFNLNVTEGDGSGGDNGGGNGGGGGGGGNPIIAVNPMNLNFFVEANSNATIPFTISNDGSPNLQWNVSTPVGDSWLSVNNPPSGSIPPNGQHNTFAAVNTNGLSEGSYTSSITITSNATNSPELIIPVSLTVDGDAGGDNGGGGNGGGGNGGNGGGGNGGDTPIINVTPEAINFFADANSNATQPFTISNDGSPNLQWNISTPAQDTWLNVNNPPSGSIPPNGEHNTFAAANTNGLSPGTYNSSITITSNASNASELVIPVTLTVNGDGGGNGGGGNSGPAIAVIPNLMEIELAPGELGSYDFDIINNGDEDLQWMLSTFIPDTWISNGMPQNGVLAPGNIATSTVEIDTNELDPGDYYSEVMVSSNAVNAEIFLIEVYLTVTDDNNGGGGDGPVAEVMTTSTELCPGSDFEILWNVTSEGFGPANTFVVQLSDADGGFSFPSILGEFQANTGNGSEWMTVPLNIPLGFNYRIRLEATNPASVGPTSGDPLTIFPAQAVSIPELPVLCSQEGQFELPQGEPSGGFYEGDFVTNNIFSPSQAGLGMHEITYNHYSPEGCLFQTTTMVEVNDAPSVALVEVGDMCTNSVAVNLSATPMGGVWSGPGVDGGMFYPELANAGTHTLHYEYSNAAGCMAEGELTVNVYDLPEITMYPAEPACQGQGLVNLPEVSPAGGTFWGEFVTGDQFDADQAPTGSYTINYSYTAESGCVNTAVTSLDVNPTPEPFMDLPLQICANAEAHHMDPNPVGGIFEGEGTDGSYFVPTMVDPGTYDVTYMAVNVHGCIGMVTSTIEVVETPMVELMMPTSVCQSEGIIPLDFGTPEGGQYTIDGVLVSTLDVSDYEPGYHEVAYYVENGAGCEGFAIDGLNIEAAPETPEITFDGTTISVFNPNNYEIQWYLNGTPITQEGNAFIPVESGVYTVTLAYDFCTSMLSNEVDVTITGIEEMTSAGISVYPVPFSEEIIIEASAVWSNEPQVRLYDANARLVYIWNKEDLVLLNGKYIINTKLALLPSGMYYLILDVPGNSYRSVITK